MVFMREQTENFNREIVSVEKESFRVMHNKFMKIPPDVLKRLRWEKND
jgi:hypothetical protein